MRPTHPTPIHVQPPSGTAAPPGAGLPTRYVFTTAPRLTPEAMRHGSRGDFIARQTACPGRSALDHSRATTPLSDEVRAAAFARAA